MVDRDYIKTLNDTLCAIGALAVIGGIYVAGYFRGKAQATKEQFRIVNGDFDSSKEDEPNR